MPKGKKHDQLILQFLPLNLLIFILLATILPVEVDIYGLIVIPFYLFGGYYFSPDLDIESSVYKRWKMLRFIWTPYKNIVPHRSIFSHGIIIGTLTRIVYLFSVVSVILLGCNFILTGELIIFKYLSNVLGYVYMNKYYMLSIFIALELSADVHIVADRTSTRIKKSNLFGFKKKTV